MTIKKWSYKITNYGLAEYINQTKLLMAELNDDTSLPLGLDDYEIIKDRLLEMLKAIKAEQAFKAEENRLELIIKS